MSAGSDRRWPVALAVALALALALAAPGAARAASVAGRPVASADRKVATAVRVTTPPIIDGKLDDPAWTEAPPDDRFVQMRPLENAPPTERTVMRIVYDDAAIYFAFACYDQHPEDIVARLSRRDREVESDLVTFIIDSRDDGASGYAFRVYAANTQMDGLFYNDNQITLDWDAVWESATSRDERGWYAEARIPLSVLRFSSRDVQEWGFQAVRYQSRKKEEDWWQYIPLTASGVISRIGRLRGLRHLKPGHTLELRPYIATRSISTVEHGAAFGGLTADAHRSSYAADIGLDAKVGLTSDLTLDGTVNPDFGQVEADQVVLNLSRYETFFPEKRPFFLESLDLFEMPVQLFYTRRIGRPPSGVATSDDILLEDGREVTVTDAPSALRILGAAKLTGKIARPLQLGLLGAVTGPETISVVTPQTAAEEQQRLAPVRGYAVGRLRYDFGNASYAGVAATALSRFGGHLQRADADHDAYTQGLDGLWLVTPEWRVQVAALLSERVGGPRYQRIDSGTACPDLDGAPGCAPITRTDGTRLGPGAVGWGVSEVVQGNGQHFVAHLEHHTYSAKLDLNDLGFLPQYGEHFFKLNAGWVTRTPVSIFREIDLVPGAVGTFTLDGIARDVTALLSTRALFRNYLELSLELDGSPVRQYDTRETFDGARYEHPPRQGVSYYLSTDSRALVVASTGGHAYFGSDGYSLGGNLEAALQVLPQLELSLTPEVGFDRAVRFYSCTNQAGTDCTIEDDRRSYRFGRLDSGYLSFTLRSSWTFSPTLTLTAYAQLFFDRGAWSRYQMIDTVGSRPRILRAELSPSSYTGDSNGDGVKDDDFQDASLNVNVVLRWEFRPGSTVIGVFTRDERSDIVLDGLQPRFQLSKLTTGPTVDVFLLKLVLFIS